MNWVLGVIITAIILIILWNIYNNMNKSTPIIYKVDKSNITDSKYMIRADENEYVESTNTSHSAEIKSVKPPINTELDDLYRPLNKDVRLDPLIKENGNCPFSKPMSSDLPIANVPMCYAKISKSYLKHT
jgi:hypothetical protein